jgi:D-arabinose 1-dehydrogenase-like Zn-dependent alcohol dehydrogenase
VAAGRNEQVLSTLAELGADLTIPLEVSENELREAFASAIGSLGFQVVIDYVWGRPVEVLLSAMTRNEFAASRSETRLAQVGESAGPRISLPAAVLRSSATILGTAGIPPRDVLVDALQKVRAHAASGDLSIDTEAVPLADIEKAWQRESQGRRLVVVP